MKGTTRPEISDIYLVETIRSKHTSEGLFTTLSLGLTPPNPIDAVQSLSCIFLETIFKKIHFGGFCAVITNQ